MSARLRGVAGALALASVLLASMTSAQDAQDGDVTAAADAFVRAQQAELRGDWAEAAQLYALADRIAPSPEALRSAARAAMEAGQHATAATHAALLLARTPVEASSRTLAEDVLRRTEGELARVEVRCARACQVTIDGRVVPGRAAQERVIYARPGTRRLRASFGSGALGSEQEVALHAGERTAIDLGAPATAQPTVAAGDGDGLTPWLFGTALVLTAVGGALSIWSGVDVLDAHSHYDPAAADAEAAFAHGRELETRTNVLFAVTGGFAITTLVLAIFTDWDGTPAREGEAHAWGRPTLAVSGELAMLGWAGTFD
ncbi:MAG: hypothetical protein U0234_12565 [Sandaracinus sp.]